MSYVYRFIDKDYRCLYVGFSDRENIYARMGDHFSSKGHLPKECYDSVARIDYKEYPNRSWGLRAETLYIHEYNPKYNTSKKRGNKKPTKVHKW